MPHLPALRVSSGPAARSRCVRVQGPGRCVRAALAALAVTPEAQELPARLPVSPGGRR